MNSPWRGAGALAGGRARAVAGGTWRRLGVRGASWGRPPWRGGRRGGWRRGVGAAADRRGRRRGGSARRGSEPGEPGRNRSGRLPGPGGGSAPAAASARRDQQAGGEQRGQPSEVGPSHPAQQRQDTVCPPPVHVRRRRPRPAFAPGTPAAHCYRAPAMAGLYDLMLLMDPTAPDERREAVIAEVETLISRGRRDRRQLRLGPAATWPSRSTTGPRPSTGSTSSRATPALLERLQTRLQDHRRPPAVPHHQGEARAARSAGAGPAGCPPPRGARRERHARGRPRRRRTRRRGRRARASAPNGPGERRFR